MKELVEVNPSIFDMQISGLFALLRKVCRFESFVKKAYLFVVYVTRFAINFLETPRFCYYREEVIYKEILQSTKQSRLLYILENKISDNLRTGFLVFSVTGWNFKLQSLPWETWAGNESPAVHHCRTTWEFFSLWVYT